LRTVLTVLLPLIYNTGVKGLALNPAVVRLLYRLSGSHRLSCFHRIFI